MEKSSKRVKDKDVSDIFEFIYNNGFGNPIILGSVPTSDQMKANTWGIYGSNLYVKFGNNVLLRFTGTVIS